MPYRTPSDREPARRLILRPFFFWSGWTLFGMGAGMALTMLVLMANDGISGVGLLFFTLGAVAALPAFFMLAHRVTLVYEPAERTLLILSRRWPWGAQRTVLAEDELECVCIEASVGEWEVGHWILIERRAGEAVRLGDSSMVESRQRAFEERLEAFFAGVCPVRRDRRLDPRVAGWS